MKKKFLTGTIKRNPDGFGFLIPEKSDHPDVYIPRHSMENIMTSDKVMVEVEPEHGGERFRGEIIRVIERGIKKLSVSILNKMKNLVSLKMRVKAGDTI